MTRREKSIERRFSGICKRRGWLAIKLNTTTANGWPDRLVLMPGGKTAFVELKAPGGKLSALQIITLSQLRNLGFYAMAFDNAEDAIEFVEDVADA